MTKEEILKLEPIQIRIEMSKLGWISEDDLTWMGWGGGASGPYGYSFWFKRWDWHGVKLGCSFSVGASDSDLNKIGNCVIKSAEKALTYWETSPNKVPEWEDNLQPKEFRL